MSKLFSVCYRIGNWMMWTQKWKRFCGEWETEKNSKAFLRIHGLFMPCSSIIYIRNFIGSNQWCWYTSISQWKPDRRWWWYDVRVQHTHTWLSFEFHTLNTSGDWTWNYIGLLQRETVCLNKISILHTYAFHVICSKHFMHKALNKSSRCAKYLAKTVCSMLIQTVFVFFLLNLVHSFLSPFIEICQMDSFARPMVFSTRLFCWM